MGPDLWRFTRPALASRHLGSIRTRLDYVRGFFPELAGLTIRVGLVRSRHALGKCSMDPEDPAIWVRPRLIDTFTVTHELTHLLQARGEIPGGERACDIYALARSPLLIDSAPSYLKVPKKMRNTETLPGEWSELLHGIARQAVRERESGKRQYIRYFESELKAARL